MALAHALQDNLTQKEQLLRVQLATSLGKPPVSLLQQCTNILSQVGREWEGRGGQGGGGGAWRERLGWMTLRREGESDGRDETDRSRESIGKGDEGKGGDGGQKEGGINLSQWG